LACSRELVSIELISVIQAVSGIDSETMREAVPMPLFVRLMCVCTFLVIANIAAFAADALTSKHDVLDGLQFTGTTGEQGKGDHHEDTISFSGGKFRSIDCENWGFGPAPYTVEKEGQSYHFSATLLSSDRGQLEWKGTIIGDTAKATFRWTHERWYWTIRRDYWFKGKRQASR
jgi:hypothetical protein